MSTEDTDIETGILRTVSSLINDDIEQKILSPLSCLREYTTKYVLEFDLPLVNKEDISITLERGNTITVQAQLKEIYCDFSFNCRNEFQYFKKSIKLPAKIDEKNIEAKFENGRLTINVPKSSSGTKIKVR